MPIKIDDSLPAKSVLLQENVFFMEENRASRQDIRPLKILIFNLMPKKIETETQLLRLLSNSPLQLEIELCNMKSHQSKNTPASHLLKFYKTFDQIKDNLFDGMIITGAPLEHLAFEEVTFWEELRNIMEWSRTNVFSTFHICWGAQAGLYYHYGIDKYKLPEKQFGIFEHRTTFTNHPLTRGFDERFFAPHSRHTSTPLEEVANHPKLMILSSSDEAGLYIASNRTGRRIFVMGHAEYDRDTIKEEYLRDLQKGININIPKNYFPNNNVESSPLFNWKSHANLLFSNWLNYFVYQMTPYELQNLTIEKE